MPSRKAYPWFFFYRIARLTLVMFLPTLFVILFLYRTSYRTGLVSQMTSQIEEDLTLLKHTLSHSNVDWEKWCATLPPLKDMNYSLIKKDGSVICESKVDAPSKRSFDNQTVSASVLLNEDLVIKKVIPVSSLRSNMNRFDRVLFLRIAPFALLSYFIFIFLFYRSTKPLGIILSKVEKFKDDLPFHKNLDLLYKRDDWSAIEEALNKADQKIQNQIQEAKAENEKNTAILESINDDIIAMDKYETILFFNSKFQNDFMRVSRGLEINKKIWHIFTGEVLEAFRSVLRTGVPQTLAGRNFPDSRSPGRFFDLTITPLQSSNGSVNGALGVFYDVTEFKLTEQMRVDFVANVSHEIRTPLTSIKGFTQILQAQTGQVDQSLHPFLDKIVSNTERMISLFNDLLHLSVIESKNLAKSEDISLAPLVSEIECNILASYPDRKVRFENDIQLEHVKGDQRLLEQVLLNLCDNACKYSSEDVEILVSSFEKNGHAYILVKDNGPGISSEHLPRIFERFYRVEASRESLRGTGLGLAIVKQIITKHNGKIWAESKGPGSGTTFVIELPLE